MTLAKTGLGALLVLAAGIAAATGSSGLDAIAGDYHDSWCSLELHADGSFEMQSLHCSYPERLHGPDTIVVGAKGRARLVGDRLQLLFAKQWRPADAPDREYQRLECTDGPRFMAAEHMRDYALAVHAGDPRELRMHRGYLRKPASFESSCDLSPLPSALRRIADAPPIFAAATGIEKSECRGAGEDTSCQTTFVLDRGEAHGLVPDMGLYFPTCDGFDYALTVRTVRADRATAELYWGHEANPQPARFLGTRFTTRMPACLPAQRERLERAAAERAAKETE